MNLSLSRFLLIFFLINLLISSFYLDSWRNANTTSRVLQVRALSETGTLNIDKFHDETIDKSFVNNHYYSDKAPLPAFLIYSIYQPLLLTGILPHPEEDNGLTIFLIGSLITGSLSFTLIILLIFNKLIKSGHDISSALILSTLPFYTSMFFVYAGTFYAHLLVVLFVLSGLEHIQNSKSFFLAGLYSGAAFLSEYLTAIIAFIWFLQILRNESVKKAAYFGLGVSPFVIGFFIYNFLITGNIFKTTYAYQVYYELENGGFTFPNVMALFEMTFLPRKGVLFYSTILLCFIPLLLKIKRSDLQGILMNYSLLPVIAYFIALSSFEEWGGGWTYGPRYLMPAVGILIYSCLPYINLKGRMKYLFAFVTAFGIVHAFSAKLTIQYSIPTDVKFPFVQNILPNVLNGYYNNQSVLSHAFNLSPQQSAICFLGIFTAAIITLIFMARKYESMQ